VSRSFQRRLMGGMLLFYAIGLVPSALAKVDYSKMISQMQEEFGESYDRHSIVFFDRVKVQQQFDALSAENEELLKARQDQIVTDYVEQKVGFSLEPSNADLLTEYFKMNIAVAVPVKKRSGERLCAIFSANAGSSAEEDSQRLLYWNQMKGHVAEYEGVELPVVLSSEDLFELSLYHETFHCLDSYYIVKQDTYDYENEETVHKAESYAEVGALLYLAVNKQKTQLAESRALYRIVGSYMAAKYGDELIGPNPYPDINFGVVYSFYPAMFAAQDHIDAGVAGLSLNEIRELAFEIVEQKAFTSTQMHAIGQYQKNPESQAELIEKFKNDDNESFAQRFRDVERFRDEYVEVLQWAFSELFSN
jgi:hypothetical protein